tara:strand:- start:3972 stop:5750 length:1779 start_codon:yes stop_codon:yes gene_type:complete
MAIGINGNVSWGIVPIDGNSSNLAGAFYEYRFNNLKSANEPLRYQIQWTGISGLNEITEPSKLNWTGGASTTNGDGDIVNVIFEVYTTTDYERTFPEDWDLIGTIKKSRDIANRKYDDGTPPSGHRFTVDISRLLSDEITYSLCPIKKGTWQSAFYGGMNGGLTMQDNVLSGSGAMGSPISNYNVSRNGSFRNVKVKTYYEVINGDGQIVSASGNSKTSDLVTVINSVDQFDKDVVYYNNKFAISETVPSTDSHGFMSRCPNHNNSTTPNFSKEVRMDDEAEWLYWFQRRVGVGSGSTSSNQVSRIRLHCRNSDGDVFYLKEFASRLRKPANYGFLQNRVCVQNVSPAYINENDGTTYTNATDTSEVALTVAAYPNGLITASTNHYRIHLQYVAAIGGAVTRHTHYRHYTIDREDEKNPYAFVKFHWLNSVGGIDSYTAKRDVVEGLTISRDVIERKSADRTWYQNDTNDGTTLSDSVYVSDTMRGGDIYKGGREVSNVNAERVQSVYTEPLNQLSAKWLEEIMLSPNVWIEKDTDSTAFGNIVNPYLRPSTKEYIPVIITNSDIQSINQAEGLVKFNIEYTFAHKLITQRN